MARTLLSPDDARAVLRRRFANQHRTWLGGGGAWPLAVLLGDPTERVVAEAPELVRDWVDAWAHYSDAGHVQWIERRWPRLGAQRIPTRLLLESPSDVARVLGEASRFERAMARRDHLVARWSSLASSPRVLRNFDALADYADDDFERLFALLDWLDKNPRCELYLRQLPVEGIDTKWCDAQRRALLTDLLLALRSDDPTPDFHALAGLRKPPPRLRSRILCPELRRSVGGLGDIEAPIEQLAALALSPACILVVENLDTGLALPELPGCVAFMKLGNGVGVLSQIPWAVNAPRALYWGDIDTHGFACLSHARAALPALTSLLMDEATLLESRRLWGREAIQYAADVPLLKPAERGVFDALRANVWGVGVRLEQERIAWPHAVEVLGQAVTRWRA
jgi:hypothetical protein